ncbi:metal ABC transporter ATP-binding protein [Natrinema sp. 1APR25-10V2]|uniref:metal ABC transporter ATP-binding protein n=1 Tax=Natrinema sp. 1APR25-10V2 TaxID=2951081 RepID=UPI002875F48E|nr:metal ABC transporter ATP-binding protein [Natrinema sp. 1APR25-10V2]MDS0473421.1 metal ABC transporter ATP-binding protein [Natrinema sp. 1APR25-10V2]
MSTQDTDSGSAAGTDEQTTAAVDSDATANETVIDVSDVTYGYTATPVIEDVSLTIDRGEYVAIVGPNGSGKSTLMQLILGLLGPDTGTAHLFGERADRFDDGDRVGYVAQQASAAKEMPITVREVVKMGRFPHIGFERIVTDDQTGIDALREAPLGTSLDTLNTVFGRLTASDWKAVDDALDTVGMSAFADRRVTQLSGGQRQRAFIARALASEADLLVLDEPTVGVDAESVDAFYDLLAALNAEGITVVLIEHDLGAVVEHADRVVCLNREVYFDGPTDEFVESDALARAFGTEPRFLTGVDG